MLIENENVNVEDMGFTEEDLAGIEVTTEPTPPATTETTPPATTETTPPAKPPATQPESTIDQEQADPVNQDDKNHGNLNVAMRAERARRKAAEERTRQLEEQLRAKPPEQSTPQQASDQVAQIRESAKQAAMKSLEITDISDLMFTDPDKYDQYISEKTRLEFTQMQELNTRKATLDSNVKFVTELKAIPDFPAVYQFALEELDGMKRKDAAPIDQAFQRIDAGAGTDADFNIIRNFAKVCQDKMQTPTVTTPPTTTLLEQAQNLPKAGALNGGGAASPTLSWDEVQKLYAEGREKEVPEEIRKQISQYLE